MSQSHCRIVHVAILSQILLDEVSSELAGANVLFVGTTRSITGGTKTFALDYECHESMALVMLESLRKKAVERFQLVHCVIVHRIGLVHIGEISVAIATSAAHRKEAFDASQWLMERIKEEVPIWKCEVGHDGNRAWVHPNVGSEGML